MFEFVLYIDIILYDIGDDLKCFYIMICFMYSVYFFLKVIK